MCARGMHERLQPCVITGRARLAARQQRRLDLGARRRWLRAHLLQRAVRGGGGALAGCRRGGRGGRAGRGGRERDSLPVRQPARGAHWRSACTAALLPAQRQVGAGLAWGGGQLAALHPLQQWLRAAPPRVAYKGPTAFATQGAAAFAHPRAAQRPCAFEAAAPHATTPRQQPHVATLPLPGTACGRRPTSSCWTLRAARSSKCGASAHQSITWLQVVPSLDGDSAPSARVASPTARGAPPHLGA